MEELFNAISDFLKSDLAKSHGWTLIAIFIVLLAISWFVISLIFLKIIVPSKTVENIELREKVKEASEELEKYKDEVKNLKIKNQELEDKIQSFGFRSVIETDEIKPSERKTLKKFTQ